MKILQLGICVALLSSGTALAQAPATTKEMALDLQKMYGDWEYVSGKKAGEDVAEDRLVGTVTISKETFKVPGGPEGDFIMAYTIDTTKSPATIDLKIESGPAPEGEAKGLIKLEGDTLWLCYEPTGGPRPEKMESTEKNNAFLFELKRKAH